jgi:hypothetical protein
MIPIPPMVLRWKKVKRVLLLVLLLLLLLLLLEAVLLLVAPLPWPVGLLKLLRLLLLRVDPPRDVLSWWAKVVP